MRIIIQWLDGAGITEEALNAEGVLGVQFDLGDGRIFDISLEQDCIDVRAIGSGQQLRISPLAANAIKVSAG